MSRRRVIALLAAVLTVAGLGAASYMALPSATTQTQPVVQTVSAALALPGLNLIEEIAERGAAGIAARPRLPYAHLPADPEAQLARAERMEQLAAEEAALGAQRSARAAALIQVSEELKARLSRDSDELYESLAKDFACSIAWQNLAPQEKSDEAAATDPQGGTRERSFGQLFADQTIEAMGEVAQKLAFALGSRLLGGAAPLFNDWGQWTNDLMNTATTNFDGPPSALSQVVNVNGYVGTRAAFYYARACLAPPVH